MPVLKWRWIAVIAVAVAAVTGGLLWLFLAWSGRPEAPARIDAVKTAFGIGAGAGGVFALWLATRRQRTLELQLAETTRVAAVTERDLEERRVTELYTKAVEQLGNEKAPVRLGGLYALERLGQDNPKQRQTIVNVLCAYLRMPFDGPEEGLRGSYLAAAGRKELAEGLAAGRTELGAPSFDAAELQVRLAAQQILATHLRRDDERLWPGVSLDLRHATLVDFMLENAEIAAADFSYARFLGATHVTATFAATSWFFGAEFSALANFDGSSFTGGAVFSWARFRWIARFADTRSTGRLNFFHAVFDDKAVFEGGEHEELRFEGTQFAIEPEGRAGTG
ncbi:pentapeptide repeat-containing protein [Amycolatopsis kentuckyensis]|uniref:pentapeptide repeat-containing protein n=1 Tax=Amycolatopsis kentuckyensis TaxID=218823 RepID=UPI001AC00692|nr:pentapeptide repeat-containing protein [Amycolatopsis kentuckyensis]